MLEYLKRPCVFFDSTRVKWIFSIGIGLYVFLFLIIFRPFYILDYLTTPVLFTSFVYSIISFLLSGVYAFGWHTYAERQPGTMTVGSSLVVGLIQITIIGILNHFWGVYTHQVSFVKAETLPVFFLKSILFTHAIGLAPFIFMISYFEAKLRNHHIEQSKTVSTHTQKASEITLLIQGENQEAPIPISSDSFRFARASGNYVEYHSMEKGTLKKKLQRITLSKLEEHLNKAEHIFMKTHRSYIVNLSCVEKVSGNAQGYTLTLQDIDETIPVSRYKVNEFNAVMNGTPLNNHP